MENIQNDWAPSEYLTHETTIVYAISLLPVAIYKLSVSQGY